MTALLAFIFFALLYCIRLAWKQSLEEVKQIRIVGVE